MAKRTALYRLYDSGNQLLYIGITEKPEQRWKGHAKTKPWWPQVTRKTIEWYDTRELAEAAEVAAIRTERTPYNVDDSPWAERHRTLEPDELLPGAVSAMTYRFDERPASERLLFVVGRSWKRPRQAALVPVDLGELIRAVGGVDVAATILTGHVRPAAE